MVLLLGILLSLSASVFASRTMQGPPFPWHDWLMIAYQGPNSFHQKAFDIYVQNVSNVAQTVKLICEFKGLENGMGQWGGVTYTPLQVTEMGGGTSIGTHKFQRASVSISPNEVVKFICQVNYSAQQNMGTNYRDHHQKGILHTNIEVSEDRGAIIAFINSRSENGSTGGAAGPLLKDDGAVNEAMLRNISKTFFFNGGRAF